jgi:branched-chain amino acid transport system ATP-binding protein
VTAGTATTTAQPVRVAGLRAGYGRKEVLAGIDLSVAAGEVAVVLGPNGAGKTTLLRALSGTIRRSGSIRLGDRETVRCKTRELAALRLGHVPEGRGTFTAFTVAENLRLGGYVERERERYDERLERALALFPRLKDRWRQQAGSLSGGEQQMLAVARALMMGPRVLLLDEPSMGLAPKVTKEMFAAFGALSHAADGPTMVLVEQNAALALDLADRAHILESGRIVASGTAEDIRSDPALKRAYLGV